MFQVNNIRRVTRVERSSPDPLEDIPCRIEVAGATARLRLKCSLIAAIAASSAVHGTLAANEEGRPLIMTLSWWTNKTDAFYINSRVGKADVHFRGHTLAWIKHFVTQLCLFVCFFLLLTMLWINFHSFDHIGPNMYIAISLKKKTMCMPRTESMVKPKVTRSNWSIADVLKLSHHYI